MNGHAVCGCEREDIYLRRIFPRGTLSVPVTTYPKAHELFPKPRPKRRARVWPGRRRKRKSASVAQRSSGLAGFSIREASGRSSKGLPSRALITGTCDQSVLAAFKIILRKLQFLKRFGHSLARAYVRTAVTGNGSFGVILLSSTRVRASVPGQGSGK